MQLGRPEAEQMETFLLRKTLTKNFSQMSIKKRGAKTTRLYNLRSCDKHQNKVPKGVKQALQLLRSHDGHDSLDDEDDESEDDDESQSYDERKEERAKSMRSEHSKLERASSKSPRSVHRAASVMRDVEERSSSSSSRTAGRSNASISKNNTAPTHKEREAAGLASRQSHKLGQLDQLLENFEYLERKSKQDDRIIATLQEQGKQDNITIWSLQAKAEQDSATIASLQAKSKQDDATIAFLQVNKRQAAAVISTLRSTSKHYQATRADLQANSMMQDNATSATLRPTTITQRSRPSPCSSALPGVQRAVPQMGVTSAARDAKGTWARRSGAK